MNFTINQNIAIQLAFLAIQFLVPAFLPITPKQEAALATFLTAAQATVAIRAHQLTQDGRTVKEAVDDKKPS